MSSNMRQQRLAHRRCSSTQEHTCQLIDCLRLEGELLFREAGSGRRPLNMAEPSTPMTPSLHLSPWVGAEPDPRLEENKETDGAPALLSVVHGA